MDSTITFFFVADEETSSQARNEIQKLRNVRVVEMHCPPSIREFYRVPFLRDESGSRHFGLEGIRHFVLSRTG